MKAILIFTALFLSSNLLAETCEVKLIKKKNFTGFVISGETQHWTNELFDYCNFIDCQQEVKNKVDASSGDTSYFTQKANGDFEVKVIYNDKKHMRISTLTKSYKGIIAKETIQIPGLAVGFMTSWMKGSKKTITCD